MMCAGAPNRLGSTSVHRVVAVALLAAVMSACSGAADRTQEEAPGEAEAIPRTPDGRPDFTGVWAGPGFAHTGEPTDNATVRRYTESNMAPIKPGGQAVLNRPHTGN